MSCLWEIAEEMRKVLPHLNFETFGHLADQSTRTQQINLISKHFYWKNMLESHKIRLGVLFQVSGLEIKGSAFWF